jgi:hypothetical protein
VDAVIMAANRWQAVGLVEDVLVGQ